MKSETPRVPFKHRVRMFGGQVIRRLHLLPGATPDGLGQDKELLGTSIDSTLIVFYPDTPTALYQIADWLPTFEQLHEEFGLTVICMDSRTGRALRERTSLSVLVIGREATIDDILSRSGVKLCFYVNFNPLNVMMMWFRDIIHVSLLHGDSDKSVSVSNQIKAFDFAFVAGQAAVDRIAANTMLYDADARCIAVGYPDLPARQLPHDLPKANGKRVLYAPTWEGGHPSVSYSSLGSHGIAMVRALLDAGYDVIYRPHPSTGVRRAEYRTISADISALLADGSRTSAGVPLEADFESADILISDISAVTSNWLRTGKPLIVTDPDNPELTIAQTRLLDLVPRLAPADASRVAEIVARELADDPTRAERHALVDYYFGDISPGAAIARTKTAVRQLIELRDAEWARVSR